MNYIIFDLEFNQEYPPGNKATKSEYSKCPFEIIQIGGIKTDKHFNTIESFNKLVKPTIFTTMNPHVEKLTNITIDQLSNQYTFDSIFNELCHFIGSRENILCVWGKADVKELYRNINYHKLNLEYIPDKYIDIQPYASKLLNSSKDHMISLRNAIDLLDISYEKPLHDAFNDAFYTKEIFKRLYNKEMEPSTYTLNDKKSSYQKRLNYSRKKTDVNKLISQFEKMYDREMTKEEKSIIKLAYVMGKTRQFEV
jgi:inhibitor of KinA sporulation pathway (predicted exonuclease)